MFRPHIGICICHNEKRLIVVKKGYCHEGNEKQKKDKKRTSFNNRYENKVFGGRDEEDGDVAGFCGQSDSDQNSPMEAFQPQKKRKPLQHRRKPTGELALFQEMWEEVLEQTHPQSPTCKCCGRSLGWELNISFFSHLLPKGLYPLYRLVRENIWIVCVACHYDWGNKSRDVPKFAAKNKEYERLKIQYNGNKT